MLILVIMLLKVNVAKTNRNKVQNSSESRESDYEQEPAEKGNLVGFMKEINNGLGN